MNWLKTTCTLKSEISKEEAIERISHLCKTSQSPYLQNEYDGTCSETHFELTRIISGRNSFKPLIKVNIESDINSCFINVKFEVSKPIKIFMGFWFGFILFTCLMLILVNLTDIKYTFKGILPLGMLGFGFLISKYGFEGEVKESKRDLIKLFEAKEIE
jgi:hypothetical protein